MKCDEKYSVDNISTETLQKHFMKMLDYGVFFDGDDVVFRKDILLNNKSTSGLCNYTFLIDKVEKLVEMVNKDKSLLEKDVETELWYML